MGMGIWWPSVWWNFLVNSWTSMILCRLVEFPVMQTSKSLSHFDSGWLRLMIRCFSSLNWCIYRTYLGIFPRSWWLMGGANVCRTYRLLHGSLNVLQTSCSVPPPESPSQTTGLLRTKVECLWIYILNWVLTNFPYKLLWSIMDTLWTVVITQPQSIVVGKHFIVTIIKLLNVISRIPTIHLLPIYFYTNSS